MPSSCTSQTLLLFKDMLRARSPTDFLCVHSSRISPILSRNITEPAVPISPRNIDTEIAVASSTGTSILRWHNTLIPLQIYLHDSIVARAKRIGYGKYIIRHFHILVSKFLQCMKNTGTICTFSITDHRVGRLTVHLCTDNFLHALKIIQKHISFRKMAPMKRLINVERYW